MCSLMVLWFTFAFETKIYFYRNTALIIAQLIYKSYGRPSAESAIPPRIAQNPIKTPVIQRRSSPVPQLEDFYHMCPSSFLGQLYHFLWDLTTG